MEIVELRVHGVHGTSPGSMLGLADGEVGQVAGDKLTGIFRPKDGVSLPYRDIGTRPISVEAYSWGSLTSGVQGVLGWLKRALWLLLLPFALANLAYWARIRLASQTGEDRWGARAVRWSALLLTIFMVLTPCVIAIDMVSWQCYRYDVPGCTHLPGIVDRMADLSAMQRVALGSTVPMLLVGLLWLLSRQSLSRYEAIKVGELGNALAPSADTCVLRNERLWKGGARTLRLQRIHLTGAIAAIVVFCGVHLIAVLEADGFWGHLTEFKALTALTLLGVLLLVACVVLLFPAHELDLDYSGSDGTLKTLREDPKLMGWLTVGALALWVTFVGVLLCCDRVVKQEMDFVGHNIWFIAVFFLLTMLHLSVFTGGRMRPVTACVMTLGLPVIGAVAIFLLYRDGELRGWALAVCVAGAIAFWLALAGWHYWHTVPEDKPVDDKAWRGAGASVLLATAAWIALLFTSSVVVAAADYINAEDHGVADLVSTVEPGKDAPDEALPPTTVDQNEVTSTKYVASGDVTVEEANVELVGDEIRVTSGRVVAERLYLDGNGVGRIAIEAGKEEGTEQATLSVEGATIRLVDSCFGGSHQAYRPPAKSSDLDEDEFRRKECTAEKDGFHASAVLPWPDPETGMQLVIAPFADVQLKPTAPPQQPLVVPQVLIWTPIGQLAWLLLVAGTLGWCVTRYSSKAGKALQESLPDQGGGWPDATVPPKDRGPARKARASAGLAHRAERLLDIVGFITSPVALAIIVCSASGVAPWELIGWTRPFATISMYVVLAFSIGLIALGSQMRRSESTRKAVGVIWDLTTFWPRAAHPLGPPCYAERVVPELERRTRWVLGRSPDNLVILSGHSQGSLIVASMASRLSDEELKRVRFISYGSQIRGLYGRVFPRVFGAKDIGYRRTTRISKLDDPFPDLPGTNDSDGPPMPPPPGSLRARIGADHWISFFRRTDPLGYRVFSDADSYHDRPVPEVPIEQVGDPGPVVMTHSGYQHTYRYRWLVAQWTREQVVRPPDGTTKVPTLPPI